MNIIKDIIKNIRIFLENLNKEDDIEQDLRRNFSERYSYLNRSIKKFL